MCSCKAGYDKVTDAGKKRITQKKQNRALGATRFVMQYWLYYQIRIR